MAAEIKVFSSEIERGQKPLQNNLYDLLDSRSVKPSYIEIDEKSHDCDFKPRTDKLFVPKKRSTLSTKVKTVRHIRVEYEKFVNSYLPEDITNQENVLFSKIRSGSSRNIKTINLARKLLKSDIPISRSALHMLTNLNPNKNANPIQYVLWNGKNIRVTGSIGGEKKFLCNFDLGKKKTTFKKPLFKKHANQKYSLLKTSLAVDFKPGPLSKKTELDISYQKKHVGTAKLVKLPKIGLDVEPSFGVPLEPTISNILHTLRENNGKLTKKWSLFAVSTLVTIEKSDIVQSNKETVTFDLNFKNHQNNILMRRDEIEELNNFSDIKLKNNAIVEDDTIKNIVDDMLKAVEISVIQEELFEEDSSSPIIYNDEFGKNPGISKVKPRNKFIELEKLDVTVIRVSESADRKKETNTCKNSFCRLGCICTSLESRHNFKIHCGRIDCMFECKCDFTKYKVFSSLNSQCEELIPGLLNYDDKISSKLAKEEKKFHQTVVLTEDDSILLKAQRRNLKTPKRYADYFSNGNLKNIFDCDKKFLSISATKLNCFNVRTWCMVHNLYQCFCKGRFVETTLNEPENVSDPDSKIKEDSFVVKEDSFVMKEDSSDSGTRDTTISSNNDFMKLRDRTLKSFAVKRNISEIKKDESSTDDLNDGFNSCSARTEPFKKRRFLDSYYSETNKKIKEMEQNDRSLHDKLMSYLPKEDEILTSAEPNTLKEKTDEPKSMITDVVTIEDDDETSEVKKYSPKYFENKNKLVTWLEANYKKYKERIESGNNRIIMEAPTPGKFALYPWVVILERYQRRKNYFVVTKEEPYRIFVAVDLNKPFFNNCININSLDMRTADIKKYPVTVINLINEVPSLNDNFYIMCGMTDCWELIGSVTKLKDKNVSDQQPTITPQQIDVSEQEEINLEVDVEVTKENTNTDDISKWFAMIVKDDFDEIQFHSRGFFVKYTNIIKAINVARASGKTVRLSSQKSLTDDEFPRFGVYALPILDEIRVYVGPYKIDDVLGIDTLKTSVTINFQSSKNKSRGVWMIIKTEENIKVIDEPLNFWPDIDNSAEIIILNNANVEKRHSVTSNEASSSESEQNHKETQKKTSIDANISVKVLKPIKINKDQTFYPKTSLFSLLKSPIKRLDQDYNSVIISNKANSNTKGIPVIKDIFSLSTAINVNENNTPELIKVRPVAEIAPQQKEKSASLTTTAGKSKLGGMFILKPEEINKRLSQNMIFSNENTTVIKKETISRESDDISNMDIENFLATSKICVAPNITDVYEVSDDEEITNIEPKEVWIECVNIDGLGFIKGKRNSENKVSFEFPGFKFTDFYDEEEAFTKINQVLSRKVYVPKQIHVQWKIIDSMDHLKYREQLNASSLGPNFILTKRGLRFKTDVLIFNSKDSNASLSYLHPNIASTLKSQISHTPAPQVEKLSINSDKSSVSPEQEKGLMRCTTKDKKSEESLSLEVPSNAGQQVTEETREHNDV